MFTKYTNTQEFINQMNKKITRIKTLALLSIVTKHFNLSLKQNLKP